MEISKTIAAPREKLFNAWLDPEMLAKFMTPGPNMTVPEASADPKVGGRFDVVMRAGDQDLPHAGTYKVIDPHNRISFAWENPFYTLEDSIVTIDFEDVDGGNASTRTWSVGSFNSSALQGPRLSTNKRVDNGLI